MNTEHLKQKVKMVLSSRRRKRPDDAPRPISAADLASAIGLTAKSRETRRRTCRALVSAIRKEGFAIASTLEGYWIAETTQDHQMHQDWLRKTGLGHLVAAAQDRQSSNAADAGGQLTMFDTAKTKDPHRY